MLPPKIESYLNSGHAVVAEFPSVAGTRGFIRIRPIANPAVPREEYRYLNSRHTMWEYWHYEFRRMILRDGWQEDDWNYDYYLVGDEYVMTNSKAEFEGIMLRWVSDPARLRPDWESECPE